MVMNRDSGVTNVEYWDIMIMNTGSTTGTFSGIVPCNAVTDVNMCPSWHFLAGLSWANAQTLQVRFNTTSSGFAQGISFTAEALN